MKTSYDVVVVGGGPAGSMAAWETAKGGASVCLLEKDRDIGYPVRCGEAVSEGIKQFVDIKGSWIAEKITGAIFIAPNSISVDLDFPSEIGYILNRRIFDYDLSRYAAEAGAEVYTKAYVKGIHKNNGSISSVILDHMGEEKEIKTNIIIGADGLTSRVGRCAGIRTQVRMKDMESAVQYSVSNIDVERNKMVFYVGKKYAPGGYLWVFPKGNRFANVGIGISGKYSKIKSAKTYLDEFMKNKYPEAAIHTTMCGGVPIPKPMKKPISNGLMLVGDAAHQINPMTGGGIESAMQAGSIAGQIAATAIKKSDYSEIFLQAYSDTIWKDFGKEYEKYYYIKQALEDLTDDDLNSITDQVLSIPLNKRTLHSFIKCIAITNPTIKLLRLLI